MENFLKQVKDKCQNTKILGIIGVALLILGNFFAYAKVSIFGISQGVSFIKDTGGILVLIIGILSGIILFKNLIKLPENISQKLKILDNPKVFIVPAVASAIIMLIANGEIFNSEYGSLIKPGFGCFVLWIGVIVLIAYSFIYKGKKEVIEVKKEED